MKQMKQFTPMQYLAIDVANHFGLDKQNYEDRIAWVKTNIDSLESFTDVADEPLLYSKAVKALRDTQQGIATGHTVAFDSACSGLQLMSVMTNCIKGCTLTGLIDPNNRMDAYTHLTQAVNKALGANLEVSRKEAKEAVMTALYGSKQVPKLVFGEENVHVFFDVLSKECTGAYNLLNILLNAWDSTALVNEWTMPDNHQAYCPVVQTIETRITVTEDNFKFSPRLNVKLNEPKEYDKSLAANMVHSVDGFVLRELVRRCKYHKGKVMNFLRSHYNSPFDTEDESLPVNQRYKATKYACMGFLDMIEYNDTRKLNHELRKQMVSICEQVLKHDSFDIVVIHDSFACHANHMQHLRHHYNEILAQLAGSTVIDDLLTQILGKPFTARKNPELPNLIRASNYGIT